MPKDQLRGHHHLLSGCISGGRAGTEVSQLSRRCRAGSLEQKADQGLESRLR